ncbi:MAG: twin-arginine translocation signal domain-containing protein, partial [Planctomycetota bacterium]|nr:twin-arginine translocation signal domain-containing protein [Planctomycetota bacterium]
MAEKEIEHGCEERPNRRDFLQKSTVAVGTGASASWLAAEAGAQDSGNQEAAKGEPNCGPAKPGGNAWKPVLDLDSSRRVTSGSEAVLCEAIGRGADLRILTEFVYNEHINVNSDNAELVREVSDFRVTYLLEDRWAAGIMSLRMPICPPEGFGERPSMSFFMYNQDGQQAIARPYLDGPPADGRRGASPLDDHGDMPKYHQLDSWDADTNAPSSNFIYDFHRYRYIVCDNWVEVYSHTADGKPESGSIDALYEAFSQGREIKVGIRGLCDDLGGEDDCDSKAVIDHTVFVHTGPGYYCTKRKIFCAGSQPVVRVRPGIPMKYASGGWDFGWLMPRSDGFVDRWICDPYTLRFRKSP